MDKNIVVLTAGQDYRLPGHLPLTFSVATRAGQQTPGVTTMDLAEVLADRIAWLQANDGNDEATAVLEYLAASVHTEIEPKYVAPLDESTLELKADEPIEDDHEEPE